MIKRLNQLHLLTATYVLALFLLALFGYHEIQRIYTKKIQVTSFYNMPHIEMTLSSLETIKTHARIRIVLEVDKKDILRIESFQPPISEAITHYMYEQDIRDLRQPAYMLRLRKGLLEEVNNASGPVLVHDLTFREFVIWN